AILSYGCFNRLVNIQFGHLTLHGLSTNNIKQHLDDNYETGWLYIVVVRSPAIK
ncbi:unnamed protein product, partial [Rotaria sordida]